MALRLSETNPQEDFRNRFAVVTIFIGIVFVLILGRVWYLQIFNGRKWREFSEANRIEIKRIPAMRGRILDRNGKIIADSRASFDLTMTPAEVRANGSVEDTLSRLIKLLNWKDFDETAIFERLTSGNQNDPIVIKRDMTRDEVAVIMVRQYAFPGVEVTDSPARAYPFGTHGSHYLGYLGEVSRNDLRQLETGDENQPYRLGDVWGIAGVEKTYESVLKGEDGIVPIIADAWGRRLGEELSNDLLPAFQARPSKPGQDLVLSIDTDVQEAAEAAFVHPIGAVVALSAKTGDVLALVSRPEFVPENFVRGVSSEYWRKLLRDPQKPLYDRALRGAYPPGSTFKMITAAAALEEKVTHKDEQVFCPGFYRLGREVKRCWNKNGHGYVDLHKALGQSCDVYFYEMGRRLGVDRIAQYARSFGMGRATGIGINKEEDGLVPTEEWKRKIYRQPWVGGETLSVAIGQGALQITPIQMAVALGAMTNGGSVMEPRLAMEARSVDGTIQERFAPNERSKVSLNPENWRNILEGLSGVVNEPGGTAYYTGRSTLFKIGGKTGTSQVVGRLSGLKVEDHAWFIGFAPVDQPEIVVSVIVEYGGHGGTTAAPIAKKVIETYLSKLLPGKAS